MHCCSAPKGTNTVLTWEHAAVTVPGCVAAAPKPLLPNGLGEPSDAGAPNPGVAGAPNPGAAGAPKPVGHKASNLDEPTGAGQRGTRKKVSYATWCR